MATKKVKQLLFPPVFCCCWIQDPTSGMEKNSGINIPDPQH